MGKHEKDKNDTAPASKYVGLDYDKTGGGKSSPSGWGGDRSTRE